MANQEGSAIPAGFASVTRDEFFRVIGPQNVTPYPRGIYPYVSEWKTPGGSLRGWSCEEVYALPCPNHHYRAGGHCSSCGDSLERAGDVS